MENTNINHAERTFKTSGLSAAAFALSLAPLLTIFVNLIQIIPGVEFPPAIKLFTGVLVLALTICAFILSLISVFGKGEKKALSIAALVISSVVLTLFILIIVIYFLLATRTIS